MAGLLAAFLSLTPSLFLEDHLVQCIAGCLGPQQTNGVGLDTMRQLNAQPTSTSDSNSQPNDIDFDTSRQLNAQVFSTSDIQLPRHTRPVCLCDHTCPGAPPVDAEGPAIAFDFSDVIRANPVTRPPFNKWPLAAGNDNLTPTSQSSSDFAL